MTTRVRYKPALRKVIVLECAVALAEQEGYREITRDRIAEVAGVSGSSLN